MAATEITQRMTCLRQYGALCSTMAYENANFYHHLCTMTSLVSRIRTSTNNIFVNDLLVFDRRQWSFREGTRGNVVTIVEKLPERMGTAFPSLKVFKNTLWTALRIILRRKMHNIAGFCI